VAYICGYHYTPPRLRGEGEGASPRIMRQGLFPERLEISSHVIVPKAENAIPMLAEPLISDSTALAPRMLPAVNFNDEPMFAANKVCDVRPYRLLANEFEPIQATRAKSPPELSLRNRCILPKPSG
jgi:hypothetical protein